MANAEIKNSALQKFHGSVGNAIKIGNTVASQLINPIYAEPTTYEEPINYRQQAIEDQERLFAREDAVRKEVQMREDNAYRRAVEDAHRAGINPNLIDLKPAESGGGIHNASDIDYTMQSAEYNRETEMKKAEYERQTQLLIQQIANEFNMKENDKDRLIKIFQTGGYLGAQLLK